MKHYELISHEYLQKAFRLLAPALHDTVTVDDVLIHKKPLEDSLVYMLKDRTPKGFMNVFRYVRNGDLVSQIEYGSKEFFQRRKEVDQLFQDALGKYMNSECKIVKDAYARFCNIIALDWQLDEVTNNINRHPHVIYFIDFGRYVHLEIAALKEKPDFSKALAGTPEQMGLIREFAGCEAQGLREACGPHSGIPTAKDLANDAICLRFALGVLMLYQSENDNFDFGIDKRTQKRAKELAKRIGNYEEVFSENKDSIFNIAKIVYQKNTRGTVTGLEQITKEWDYYREIERA